MKAHRFDPLSFTAGLVFTVLGLAAAAGGLDDLDTLRVVWPAVLVLFGMLLIGSTVRPAQRRTSTIEAAPIDEPPIDESSV